jgi:hypothetical protein
MVCDLLSRVLGRTDENVCVLALRVKEFSYAPKRPFSIKFKEKLERELSADESVLWMDEPAPIFAKNLFLIIVSVAFLFSLFAIDSFNAWTASLFAIIIVAVIILGSKVRF